MIRKSHAHDSGIMVVGSAVTIAGFATGLWWAFLAGPALIVAGLAVRSRVSGPRAGRA